MTSWLGACRDHHGASGSRHASGTLGTCPVARISAARPCALPLGLESQRLILHATLECEHLRGGSSPQQALMQNSSIGDPSAGTRDDFPVVITTMPASPRHSK